MIVDYGSMMIGCSNFVLSQLNNLDDINIRSSCDFQVCASVLIELKGKRVEAILKDKQISLWSRKVIFDQEGSKFKKKIDLDSTIQLYHN